MIKYPLIKPNVDDLELNEIKNVLASGWLTQGPYVEKFEREVAKYVGAKYAVAVTSCTAALYLSLKALRIGRGDEVILPDFTFPATGNVVLELGATPVLVDVKEDSFSIDPESVNKALTKRTKAIIPVHPFGHPADMDEIMEIAESHGVWVIEDAATALGSIYKGRYAGTIGDVGCYSFHPRKLVTTGEGGMIVLNDEKLYEKLLTLRNHGKNKQGVFETYSLNFRMSDIQAAIGCVQLKKLNKTIEERRRLAEIYHKLITTTLPSFTPLKERPNTYSTYQSYVVKLPNCLRKQQKDIISEMRKHGIEIQIGTYALHLEKPFSLYAKYNSLPVSEMLRESVITLPLYNSLKAGEINFIIGTLKNIVSVLTNK